MSIIYQPKGKAREYSPLACNVYIGCNHQCKYCYAPRIQFKKPKDYKEPIPKRNILNNLEIDCKKYAYTDKNVLLCFMSDPYNIREKELKITREALKLFFKFNIPISILSKAGKQVLDDIDIFKKFKNHIQIGSTLTFDNEKDSKEWEPEADIPENRIETLKILKENNIITWASFEPVIRINQSLNMIKKSLKYVDIYKIGKLNNYQGLDKNMDWNYFLKEALNILRTNNKKIYIKYDLRIAASKNKLYGNEILMDEFNTEPFEKNIQLNLFENS